MKKIKTTLRFSMFTLGMASLMLTSCNDDETGIVPPVDMPGMAPNVNITVLSNNNSIIMYNAQNLGAAIGTLNVSGLPTGEQLISIDYRPATGQLYALGSSSKIYFIHEGTGAATALNENTFMPAIDGNNASIDFNPTVDRIRLVTESGQNLRLHPELGTVVATDGSINGGNNPRIGAVAYTNSMAGANSTQLYDIDFETDKLYIQTPPNDGGLQEVGNLTIDFSGQGDFDIAPDNNAALAVTLDAGTSKLYDINLASGKATWVGTFGSPIISIAIKTNPVAFATSADGKLYRFNPLSPSMNSVDLMGLESGEQIVGLDFRPAKGILYAISNQSRLLTVNTSNGQLTAVGTLMPMLSGTSFGFDFNPTVDRIRLVSNTGQNLRLHPDLGTVVATDGNLNPGMPFINGSAYTNNMSMATSTLLYGIDSETNQLFTQNPPNDGVLVPVGNLGVNVTAENGFDIGGLSNQAFALFTVDNMNGVYSINLSNGAATKIADFPVNVTAMAVGLGF